MDNNTRAEILNTSYDIIENPIEVREEGYPGDTDEFWRRPRSQEPKPGRRPALDTARGRANYEQSWNEYVDARAIACIDRRWDELHAEAIGYAISTRCRELINEEIAALRRELAATRAQLRTLRREGAAQPKIRAWDLDRRNYKATPILEDGRPSAVLNLRPFFETYHWETT